MSKPLISIILPTFNRSQSLTRAIDSVLTQSFTDFELIIIDDGSTDGTPTVIENYKMKDQRIKSLRLTTNHGAAFARNRGLEKALGDFIAFQDSDDSWQADKLTKQYQLIKDLPADYGFVFSTYNKVHANRSRIEPKRLLTIAGDDLFLVVLRKNLVGTPTALIRKSCLDQTGLMNEQLKALEDWEFFIRIAKQYKAKYTTEPLIDVYLEQKDRLSKNFHKILEARILIFKLHRDDIKKHVYIKVFHLAKIAAFYLLSKFGTLTEH